VTLQDRPATMNVVATVAALSFLSFWRAAAIVLSDPTSCARYAGCIAEQAIGKSAPWFILAIMLFTYAVRGLKHTTYQHPRKTGAAYFNGIINPFDRVAEVAGGVLSFEALAGGASPNESQRTIGVVCPQSWIGQPRQKWLSPQQ